MVVRLEETLGFTHGTLDMERTDILPLFLEQRNQKVDGKHDVLNNVVFLHVDVTDSHAETKHLFELELDGRSDFVDFSSKVLGVRDWGWEFTSLGKTRAEKTDDDHQLDT